MDNEQKKQMEINRQYHDKIRKENEEREKKEEISWQEERRIRKRKILFTWILSVPASCLFLFLSSIIDNYSEFLSFSIALVETGIILGFIFLLDRIWREGVSKGNEAIEKLEQEKRDMMWKTIRRIKSDFFLNIHTIEMEKNYLKNKRIFGKVKSIKEFSYKPSIDFMNKKKGARISGDIFEEEKLINFNDNGSLLEMNWFNEARKLKDRLTFQYDDNGNLIKRNLYDSEDNLEYYIIFNYNNQGDLIEKGGYKKNGKQDEKLIYKYDENKNLIKVYSYSSGTLYEDLLKQRHYTFKYNDKKNKIECISYNSDNLVDHEEKAKYDDNNNMIEEIRYGYNTIYKKNIFKYDSFNRIIEKCCYHNDGSIDTKYSYKYNQFGNLIEDINHKAYYDHDFIKIYFHKYDPRYNWSKRTEISINSLSSAPFFDIEEIKFNMNIHIRHILYYE